MAAAHALHRTDDDQQLALYQCEARLLPPRPAGVLCAGCREKEARYGFRNEDGRERPRTLCFGCFRIELTRRREVAARLARGWNAEQVALPLTEVLEKVTRRRRRAQIAARHALGL